MKKEWTTSLIIILLVVNVILSAVLVWGSFFSDGASLGPRVVGDGIGSECGETGPPSTQCWIASQACGGTQGPCVYCCKVTDGCGDVSRGCGYSREEAIEEAYGILYGQGPFYVAP